MTGVPRLSAGSARAPGYCVWCNSSGHAATTECYETYKSERDRPRTNEELAHHLEVTRNRLTGDDIKRIADRLRAAPQPVSVAQGSVNADLLQACKGAAEWLSGWASAEPYLSRLESAITKAEASPAPSSWQPTDDASPEVKAVVERTMRADYKIGGWLSAALEDPAVCAVMKADIHAWFEAHQPGLISDTASLVSSTQLCSPGDKK